MISFERYRALLATPDVGRLVLASIPGRLPVGMTAIAILLYLQGTAGSFALAGTAAALYVTGMALVAPLLGRVIDRLGPAPVLSACAAGYPTALAALVWAVSQGGGAAWVCTAAFCAGASLPPISSSIRALFRQLLHEDARMVTAYSLDSALIETLFILGPVLVSAFAAYGRLDWAVLAAGACGGIGSIVYLRSRGVRRWRADPHAQRSLAGPLGQAGFVPILAASLGYAMAFGLFEVSTVAVATRAGAPAAAGLILAVASVGSGVGVLLYGSRNWRAPVLVQYRLALVAMGLGLALVAPVGNLYLFGALSVIAGAPMSIVIASQSAIVAGLAPRHMLAESFTWATTCLLSGVGGGIALGGWLLERHATAVPLAAAAGTTLAAALVATVAVSRARLERAN